ncbi:hypothetical protein GCM10010174_80600 [Kutzneria viridogrisea]|uniref:Uncharacterized protein n=1 Tax=Kutzneria viridogrisea TaxID=47990 RepID=A0ABR6BYX9_9PSEU|nr:hypothetical protein [Kutzneria viridogrisea]
MSKPRPVHRRPDRVGQTVWDRRPSSLGRCGETVEFRSTSRGTKVVVRWHDTDIVERVKIGDLSATIIYSRRPLYESAEHPTWVRPDVTGGLPGMGKRRGR